MNFHLIIKNRLATLATIPFTAESAREAGDRAHEVWEASGWTDGRRFGQNCEVRYLPQVGDGAHYGGNGDAYPVTIVEVSKSGHRVKVQHARVVSVEAGQEYHEGPKRATFEADPEGSILTFTRRMDGRYCQKGCSWGGLGAGYATAYNPHV